MAGLPDSPVSPVYLSIHQQPLLHHTCLLIRLHDCIWFFPYMYRYLCYLQSTWHHSYSIRRMSPPHQLKCDFVFGPFNIPPHSTVCCVIPRILTMIHFRLPSSMYELDSRNDSNCLHCMISTILVGISFHLPRTIPQFIVRIFQLSWIYCSKPV